MRGHEHSSIPMALAPHHSPHSRIHPMPKYRMPRRVRVRYEARVVGDPLIDHGEQQCISGGLPRRETSRV